ncbi:unnamed protein product, partial [Closterium sp. NIES-53]
LFLSDIQTEWRMGWKVGGKCSPATEIKCDASGMITSIRLTHNNFVGSIPNSISKLTALIELELGYNSLTGSIPNNISALMALEYL